jgi:methylglutaconyl-CoA hydratase
MSSYSLNHIFKNGVLEIEIFHDKANCLAFDLVKEFRNLLLQYQDHADLRLLYVKSKGDKVYSAGANLADYKAFGTEERIAEYLREIGLLLTDILYYPCATLTSIRGKAVGGGVGLVSAFDYSIGAEDSSYRLSEISLGIAPLVISPFLLLKMSLAKFNELSLSGDWKSAHWAYNAGLLSEVVENKDLDKVLQTRIVSLSASGITPIQCLKDNVLPNKAEFLKRCSENSTLNAPYVVRAIEEGRI